MDHGEVAQRSFRAGRLQGRSAVVIHVGSELGRACALRFADEGARVLVSDPLDDVAQQVAEDIREAGGRAAAVQAPFGNEEAIDSVVRGYAESADQLDVLMVAGGAFDWWSEAEDTMENWEELFRVNLLTPIFYAKAFRPLLARSGAGSVIFYGSIDGVRGNPRLPAYSAARAGLIPATHTMAHEFGPDGIRVNLIAGAAIHSLGREAKPLRGETYDEPAAMRSTPLGRRARPEEFAGIALFLASSDSSYVTGSVITADGGRTAITPGTSY
jgi:NAD(P)-dependent dehydrogenase (short-subunit alcohol dehydrogenase family)